MYAVLFSREKDHAREIFQLNGEKYDVLVNDTGLRVELLKMAKVSKKQATKRR